MSAARICDACGIAATEWENWWTVNQGADKTSVFFSYGGSSRNDDDEKPRKFHVCSLPCLSELAFKQLEVGEKAA